MDGVLDSSEQDIKDDYPYAALKANCRTDEDNKQTCCIGAGRPSELDNQLSLEIKELLVDIQGLIAKPSKKGHRA